MNATSMFWPAPARRGGVEGVGQHVAARDRVAGIDQRSWLVQVFWFERVYLVRYRFHARLAGQGLVVVDPHHDARGIDRIHHAAATADHGTPESIATGRSMRSRPAGLRTQRRHRLALHVRSHQRALAIVMPRNGISEAATDTICFGDTSS